MRTKISQDLIENILLCDPITFRGRLKLKALGLENTITPSEFWGDPSDPNQGIWVSPIDVSNYKEPVFDASDLIIHYPEHYETDRIEKRREKLNSRFNGSEDVALIALKGVVGSGKSIEMHRQVFANYKHIPFQSMVKGDTDPNAILVDLERDVQFVDAKEQYRCADPKQPIHLFLTSSLETLTNYVWKLMSSHRNELACAKDNLREFFYRDDYPLRTVSDFEYKLIENISLWASDLANNPNVSVDIWQDLCQQIIDNLKTKHKPVVESREISLAAAQEDIIQVYKLLFLLSYCAFPNTKKAFIIDNIEDYIAVRTITEQKVYTGIPVSNNQILLIYTALYQTKQRIKEAFEKYSFYTQKCCNQSITFGMAIRRTTHQLLCNLYMGSVGALYDDIFDITGDLALESLWTKKYELIWKKHLLKDVGEGSAVNRFILFANSMILEGDNTLGIPYPIRMMRMLSRGVRRVGHNISYNLYSVFSLLSAGNSTNKRRYITVNQFSNLLQQRSAARGMLRQALIEFYYMGQIYRTHNSQDAVGLRWRLLNLGHLGNKKTDYLFGKDGRKRKGEENAKITYNEIIYSDGAKRNYSNSLTSYRSLLSRVLVVLAERLDTSSSECVAPEYLDMELKTLLTELFPYKPTIAELRNVAQVLIAASSPEREGDFTPYVIMELKAQDEIDAENGTDSFAYYLQKIWDEPDSKKGEDKPLSNIIRITEGGFDFLFQWQASYSFYSSLYCYNFAPLFFINSKELVFHILNRVYNNADIMRQFYHYEAIRFARLAPDITINDKSLPDKYLHNADGIRMSFDKMLSKLHVDYLALYEQYIKECYQLMGISDNDKEDLLDAITVIREKYLRWSTQVLCF